MPPTPQQISHSSTDESQWQADLEAQRSIWSTLERTVIAGMEKYLDKSDDMRVVIELSGLLMDPEDSEVSFEGFPNACKKERQQDFRDLQYERGNVGTWWQAETVGWSTKERGSRSKRGRKAI